MKIVHFIDEAKKSAGRACFCAELECDSEALDIYERASSYEEADKLIIERLKQLQEEIAGFVKETSENIDKII